MRSVEEWRALARANKSLYFLQTASAPLFEEFYANPLETMAIELKQRQDYNLPPFVRIATVRIEEKEERKAELLQNTILKKIRSSFPNIRLQKLKNTKNNRHIIEIGFDVSEQTNLQKFLKDFPDSIRIDMHAESL